jgi:ABC-type Fe3+/spermidine/putrescine transport system ATPase subunit
MTGFVAEIGGADAWVKVPAPGSRVRVALKDAAPLSVGQQVSVGIRPEYVQVAASANGRPPGENVFTGTVVQTVEGVADIRYRIRLQGDAADEHYLEASLSKADAPTIPVGQACCLYLPPERLCLIRG